MATIVANGNRSVTSPAYANTDDGQFEHALNSSYIKKTLNSGYMDSRKPNVFGPGTVWRNGVAYPNRHWADLEVIPKEHPTKKGVWVHPDRYDTIKAYYDAREGTKNKVQSSVSSGINKATNAVGKEIGNMKSAGEAARTQYQRDHMTTSTPKGAPMLTRTYDQNLRNRIGETAAYARGAVGNSAAGKAVRNEAGNIRSGARAAMDAYDAANRQRTYKRDANGNMVYTGEKNTGNAVGRALAGVRGGIGASAVGRAGQAAFEALTKNFNNFKAGIDKYLTGKEAGANRAEALRKLQTQAGNLMGAISAALGTSEGRSATLKNIGKALGTVSGTVVGGAQGVAKGIANSNIGQAAISAGRTAYAKVSDKVGEVLGSIKDFFKKKYKSAPGGRAIQGA